MNINDAFEISYKNGYEKGKQDILKIICERRDKDMKEEEEMKAKCLMSTLLSGKIIELFDLIQIIEGMK